MYQSCNLYLCSAVQLSDTDDARSMKRAWFRGRYNALHYHLQQKDWEYEFSELSTNAILCQLFELHAPLIDTYVPYWQSDHNTVTVKPPNCLKRECCRA